MQFERSLEGLDFEKFLKTMQPDPQQAICMNDLKSYRAIFGGTLLFRRAVKNLIIEIFTESD
jgi:hypothetical protein